MNEAFRLRPSNYELICECSRCDCMARVDVPGDVYNKVRAAAGRYVVASGHEDDDRRVAGTTAYSVVAARADGGLALTTAR